MPIEKTYLEPRIEAFVKEDGTPGTREIPQWEIKATGKEVQELRGIFKDSAPQMMHEGWKEWNSIGEERITRPDGSVDTVRADKVDLLRSQPGFCVSATKPTFSVDGFGWMKAHGLTRMKIRYHQGQREILEAK